MSRALEPGTVLSPYDNIQPIYQDIVKALQIPEAGGLLDIEFLGKSHLLPSGCNVLIDGNSVGIPKSKLVQAFIIARRLLLKRIRSSLKETEADLRNATTVILLMDPEHLTAANTRKRIIQMYENESKVGFEALVAAELRFVDSYLTSRLHRHTKSPTLWGHRRWLLERCQVMRLKHDINADVTSVILIAAERHPKNYYAWSHLRWLLRAFGSGTGPAGKSVSDLPDVDYEDLITVVKDWCLNHPADTSGFSFLLFCLINVPELSSVERGSSVCRDVLRSVVSFKWSYESVWVFLRTLVASKVVGEEEKQEFLHAIDDIRKAHPDAERMLLASRDWYNKHVSSFEFIN